MINKTHLWREIEVGQADLQDFIAVQAQGRKETVDNPLGYGEGLSNILSVDGIRNYPIISIKKAPNHIMLAPALVIGILQPGFSIVFT